MPCSRQAPSSSGPRPRRPGSGADRQRTGARPFLVTSAPVSGSKSVSRSPTRLFMVLIGPSQDMAGADGYLRRRVTDLSLARFGFKFAVHCAQEEGEAPKIIAWSMARAF